MQITKHILLILISLLVLAVTANAALPTVLVYTTNKGEGADKTLAETISRAINIYLNRSGVVESAVFDKASPSVIRAIMEGNLSADLVGSFESIEARLKVADILRYDYAVGSEVTVIEGHLNIHLWVGTKLVRKPNKWNISGRAPFNGADETQTINSVESAASSTIIEVLRTVFGVANPNFASSIDSITTTENKPDSTSKDNSKEIDEYLKAGNIAGAIIASEAAVNDDPANSILRLKLARLYIRKGLKDQALYQIAQARKYGASDAEIQDTLSKLNENTTVNQIKPIDKINPVETQKPDIVIKPTGKASNKIAEGDSFWSKGDVASAIDRYKSAIALDPSEWRAYERLALVYIASSMYYDAKEIFAKLDKIQPNPPEYVQFNRYKMLIKTIDKQILLMISQHSADLNSYNRKRMSREKFSNLVRSNIMQASSLSKFLESLPAFQDSKQQISKRLLAIGLVTQAAVSLQDYLETNDATAKTNAAVFIDQAQEQMDNTLKGL